MANSSRPSRLRTGVTLAATAFLAATMAVPAASAQAEPTVGDGISVEITHTNPKTSAAYAVGDVLNFSYTVKNLTDVTRAVGRDASNLTGDTACRWQPGTTVRHSAPPWMRTRLSNFPTAP